MAFAVTNRHSKAASTSSSGSAFSTNSTTPTADSLLIYAAAAEADSATINVDVDLGTPSGGSLSWTEQGEEDTYRNWDFADGYTTHAAISTAQVGGSPSAFAISCTPSATSFTAAVAIDITGHDTTTPVVQVKVTGATVGGGNSESGTVVLDSTPTTGNLVVVAFAAGADSGGGFATPTIGGQAFTARTAANGAYCQIALFTRVIDGTESNKTITCSDLGQSVGNYCAMALEIAVASGGTNGTATPAAIAVSTAIPAPTPQAGSVAAPSQITVTTAQPAVTPQAGSTVSPEAIAATFSVPTVTLVAGSTVTPMTIVTAVTTPAVIVAAGATVTPNALAVAVALGAVVVVNGDITIVLPATWTRWREPSPQTYREPSPTRWREPGGT